MWKAVVNTLIALWVPQNVENFLTGFSMRTLFREVG
jgi:hypothetical protein